MKLLLVDDDETNLYALRHLMSYNGHQVAVAHNGAEALEIVRDDTPDVIISDILMPVMDGFSLCRRLKSDERLRNIPFVFYTASYTDPKDKPRGRKVHR
jgi:CheY-like chemotaxis protein